MAKKYDIILAEEESLAQQVILGLIVERPVSLWRYLIPFIFIFDYIQRKREIETFSKDFLFTKKLALDAALAIIKGERRQNVLDRAEGEIKSKLTSQKLYSFRVHQGQLAEVNLLIDHYIKLLNAEGKNYDSLVKNAYLSKYNYEAFLQKLTSAEREIDRAIIELLPRPEIAWEEILKKQKKIEQMRAKQVDRIF